MRNVLVRDVPEEVHAALARRAQARGQSLQQYLAGELRRLAERPSLDEVLDRAVIGAAGWAWRKRRLTWVRSGPAGDRR